MAVELPMTKHSSKQQTTLMAGTFVLILMLVWFQWRVLASTNDTWSQGLTQLTSMRGDAERIAVLRQTPQTVAGQTRTSQELLGQVENALSAAGIDRSLWNDSVPEPIVRLPQSDYRRVGTRLYLTSLTLQQLAAFVHTLESGDATLHVSALNLTNRDQESPAFDVDLVVSYLVYSP